MRMTLADCAKADSIIHHPAVFPMICDDHFTPGQKNLGTAMLQIPQAQLLHPNEHTIFMMIARSMTLYEVHTMITPEGRGKMGVEAGREVAKWFFENSTCEKIITYVPFYNKPAKIFARAVGMQNEGVCTKSVLKNGVLHDQWVLGLEKEKICRQS